MPFEIHHMINGWLTETMARNKKTLRNTTFFEKLRKHIIRALLYPHDLFDFIEMLREFLRHIKKTDD